MKQYLLFPALLVSAILVLGGLCWAQCPEDPNDLSFCDTLITFAWDADECYSFPCTVHFSLFVTHDSNTFYWASEQEWVQDSIAAFFIPLKWYHTNPSAYCSVSTEKNTTSFTDTTNSIFRHFRWKRNRMMDLYEMGGGQEWTNIILDIGNSYQKLWMSLIPGSPEDRRWWEGDRVLLATFTFTVSDTMTICVDTFCAFPMPCLQFMRHDAVVYYPRHNMPCCMTVELQPFLRGDANGNGEVHIEDIVYLINYLFIGGYPPQPLAAGDANCDGAVDVADVIYLINYLFAGGSPPEC